MQKAPKVKIPVWVKKRSIEIYNLINFETNQNKYIWEIRLPDDFYRSGEFIFHEGELSSLQNQQFMEKILDHLKIYFRKF